jgi:hypothetical protein
MSNHDFMRLCRLINSLVLTGLAAVLLLFPVATAIHDIADPAVQGAAIPKSAWRLHRALTPRFERWAASRLTSNRAAELSTANISGTEWPLFGAVFYLWGVEALQDAWTLDKSLCDVSPKEFSRGAIEVAADLVADPRQANWVKIHWGENYLKKENVFYRMLVISALTSHARLTGESKYLALLRDQTESLAAELDASPHGLLQDYPSECYPGDVLTAVAMIRKADGVLGTDHSAFVQRAIRGFQGRSLDELGLVPYMANSGSGKAGDSARGCGNSYVSLMAPLIWPEQARDWYERYERHFWQEKWTAAGFREFPNDMTELDWHMDVDAGPVVKGFGFAACAFGAGAARVNGRFDHSYPLIAEMLAVSCPLANGTLLLPRALSNATDAPYLGEAAIFYILTRTPASGVVVKSGGSLPLFVVLFLSLQALVGASVVCGGVVAHRRWMRRHSTMTFPAAKLQLAVWTGLLVASVALLCFGLGALALVTALTMQFFPRESQMKREGKPS